MNSRIYYLDSMRGVLILFILMIHALQVYSPEKSWRIYNIESIDSIPYIIDFLLLFTLTSFFIMSGYFAVMTIQKVGSQKFWEIRIRRIMIPIITTAVTLNSFQSYLLVQNGWMKFELIDYLINGGWVSHLWFLINLVIYFLILYIGVKYFKSLLEKCMTIFNIVFLNTNIYFLLFFMSFLTVFLLAIVSIFSKYWYFGEIINLHAFVFYLPFFIFGILLYINKQILESFLNISIFYSVMIIIISLLVSNYFVEFEGKIYKIVYFFFNTASKYFASALCFHFFYKYTNKQSHTFTFLSESSYTVYLFHHVLVIAVGLLYIHYKIVGVVGLFLLVFLVGILSLLIHLLLISRSDILSFLFNGKVLNKQVNK